MTSCIDDFFVVSSHISCSYSTTFHVVVGEVHEESEKEDIIYLDRPKAALNQNYHFSTYIVVSSVAHTHHTPFRFPEQLETPNVT
jgi:hypothetical protein